MRLDDLVLALNSSVDSLDSSFYDIACTYSDKISMNDRDGLATSLYVLSAGLYATSVIKEVNPANVYAAVTTVPFCVSRKVRDGLATGKKDNLAVSITRKYYSVGYMAVGIGCTISGVLGIITSALAKDFAAMDQALVTTSIGLGTMAFVNGMYVSRNTS